MVNKSRVPFDKALDEANRWLNEICAETGRENTQLAYHALRGTLFAIRDRLPTHEALTFSSQLPMIVRGIYFEGYSPNDKPEKFGREEFVNRVSKELIAGGGDDDPAGTVGAALRVIGRNVSPGLTRQVQDNLPQDIQELWQQAA